ncbi:MAG: aspartyl-tRNA(Asn)/glutamyl-tRNA (Gln) amidotransferase subunit B, partial [Rhodospirillaceae bacterium]
DHTISGRIAKDVFEIMLETGREPATIVAERNLRQVTDTSAIETAIENVLARNADKVTQYRGGQEKLLGWFVGQVMKAMGGKASPSLLNDLLRARLKG